MLTQLGPLEAPFDLPNLRGVATQCRYLGFREHIYTGREGTDAWVAVNKPRNTSGICGGMVG